MTPAERARKAAAAHRKLTEAVRLLDELCRDYSGAGYALTMEQRAAWARTANAGDLAARAALLVAKRDAL